MKSRRFGAALAIAMAASMTVTWFLYHRIRRQITVSAQTMKIVATARQMEPGTALSVADLALLDWPSRTPLEGAFTRPEDLVGRILLYPVGAREPLRDSLLAAAGSAVGLTAKIPDGMRAVAVETNDVNNVSGFLFPGARVDVLMTLRPEATSEAMSATVLENIQVLSTGEKLQPDPSGKPLKVHDVTLLLAPEEAQKLVLASSQGTVQFVLRNGHDQQTEDPRPVSLRDLQLGSSGPAAPPLKKTVTAAKAPGSFFEVETFDGAKKGVVRF